MRCRCRARRTRHAGRHARGLVVAGFRPRTAWHFDLHGGGTVLPPRPGTLMIPGHPMRRSRPFSSRRSAPECATQAFFAGYSKTSRRGRSLHDWLAESAATGKIVLGYGAASRAVALLRTAGVDGDLLPAVADASPPSTNCACRGPRSP